MEFNHNKNKEITLEWLVEVQRMARTDIDRAKIIYGLSIKTLNHISKCPVSMLKKIADTGLIYFSPRSEKVLEMALSGKKWEPYAEQMLVTKTSC